MRSASGKERSSSSPTPAGVTLRVGTISVGRFLARRWFSLLWLLFCATMICFSLIIHGVIRNAAARSGVPIRDWGLPAAFFFLVIFGLWDLTTIIRGAICLRGTIVLTATPQGLTYRNIPVRKGSGHIAREDLRGLLVVSRNVGFRRLHILCALRENARALPLFTTRDGPQAEQARAALAHALGIESPEPASAPV